uniref:Uncharacterized protein n=1 Tax=Arundo donax TaxID=35708 RepID=A0A0A9D5J4_ARUDO
MSAQQAKISTRLAVPVTRRMPAPLLSKAEGPNVGGLYTQDPPLPPIGVELVPAALGFAGYWQPLLLGSLVLRLVVPEKMQACGFWLLRW